MKLLEKNWDQDRKAEICVPVEPFKPTVETFKSIPVGDTEMDLDLSSLKMPDQLRVNYDEHITKEHHQQETREVRMGKREPETKPSEPTREPTPEIKSEPPKKVRSLMD